MEKKETEKNIKEKIFSFIKREGVTNTPSILKFMVGEGYNPIYSKKVISSLKEENGLEISRGKGIERYFSFEKNYTGFNEIKGDKRRSKRLSEKTIKKIRSVLEKSRSGRQFTMGELEINEKILRLWTKNLKNNWGVKLQYEIKLSGRSKFVSFLNIQETLDKLEGEPVEKTKVEIPVKESQNTEESVKKTSVKEFQNIEEPTTIEESQNTEDNEVKTSESEGCSEAEENLLLLVVKTILLYGGKVSFSSLYKDTKEVLGKGLTREEVKKLLCDKAVSLGEYCALSVHGKEWAEKNKDRIRLVKTLNSSYLARIQRNLDELEGLDVRVVTSFTPSDNIVIFNLKSYHDLFKLKKLVFSFHGEEKLFDSEFQSQIVKEFSSIIEENFKNSLQCKLEE